MAQPVREGEIRIDGALDEEIWSRVRFTSDFFQKEPEQGAAATQRTEVAVLFSREALYVGARMASQGSRKIDKELTRRDELGTAERLTVSLDTYRDKRTAYNFAVTAAGVRVDWYSPEDNEVTRDYSFNPVWEAQVRVGERGWTAELRIPFSQLRFNPATEQVWGINLNRYVPTRNEDDFWVYVPRDRAAWASWFGELVGIRELPRERRLELVPYAAGNLNFRTPPSAPSPIPPPSVLGGNAGMDAKMGLGPGLTLEGTINPDFGQVEADPAQVNLTAFETFFEERRPFFAEGSQLLTGPGPGYFYSRRIGGTPPLTPDATDVVLPRSIAILGAAKLTGTVTPNLSVGALGAVTNEGWAKTFQEGDEGPRRTKVEPFTSYGVMRVQQQFGPNGSLVRLSATGVGRLIRAGDGLVEQLPQSAFTGGADWDLRFKAGEYSFSGYLGGSHVAGLPAALTRIQESSAHYFQRPDQHYLHLDPEARSLSGFTGSLKLSRLSGEHWLWNGGVSTESPGLELNDLGQLNHADSINAFGALTYRETNPGPVFRRYDLSLSASSSWDYGRVFTSASATLNLSATFRNFWYAYAFLTARPVTLSDTLTRGGPLMATGPDYTAGGGLFSSFNAPNHWSLEGWCFRDTFGGYAVHLLGSLALQLSDRIRVSLTPTADVSTTSRQYVSTVDGGPSETFGQRYVFAFVDRVQLSTQLRASWFFSPDLSLELYAEPFASSGGYSRFGELAAARSPDLRFYGEGGTSISRAEDGSVLVGADGGTFTLVNPDFNVRSFRSTVVLRWDWRPGSTLFVVWQQDRYASRADATPVGPRSLLEAFRAPGAQAVVIKLSYWLPVR